MLHVNKGGLLHHGSSSWPFFPLLNSSLQLICMYTLTTKGKYVLRRNRANKMVIACFCIWSQISNWPYREIHNRIFIKRFLYLSRLPETTKAFHSPLYFALQRVSNEPLGLFLGTMTLFYLYCRDDYFEIEFLYYNSSTAKWMCMNFILCGLKLFSISILFVIQFGFHFQSTQVCWKIKIPTFCISLIVHGFAWFCLVSTSWHSF